MTAHDDGTVSLPPGVRLDPGGIGKGLAADLAAQEMLAAGASGVCVNVAGDVCARGGGPADGRWVVGIEHPLDAGRALAVLRLPADGGAVASSSVLLRRWGAGRHHLVDPARGRSATSPVVAASVIAPQGAWADAATKIALVEPDPDVAVRVLDGLALAAVLVLADGQVRATPTFLREHGQPAAIIVR